MGSIPVGPAIKTRSEMKVVVHYEVEIDHCYKQCPYYRYYQYPDAEMIIHHPQCDTGFPEECPLLEEK